MKCVMVVVVLSGFWASAWAQPSTRAGIQALPVQGAEQVGRAGAGLALPSGWTLPGRAGGMGLYAGQPFGIPELRLAALNGHWATPWGIFGTTVQSLGLEGYRYVHLRTSWSTSLRAGSIRRLEVGVGLNLWHLGLGEFGSGMAPGVSAGVRYTVHPDVVLALQTDPLWGGKVAGVEPVPTRLQAAVAWRAHDRLHVVADVVQELGWPADWRGGMEWQVVPALRLRGGMGHDPARAAAGATLTVGRWVAHLAADRHPVLGWTPALEVGLSW